MKTNKSLAKRIKITGGKKILKRPPNQNHFNARVSGDATRRKHGFIHTPREISKNAKALLSNY